MQLKRYIAVQKHRLQPKGEETLLLFFFIFFFHFVFGIFSSFFSLSFLLARVRSFDRLLAFVLLILNFHFRFVGSVSFRDSRRFHELEDSVGVREWERMQTMCRKYSEEKM